ncbi:unnamed protein product [Alopecurus aequalis]
MAQDGWVYRCSLAMAAAAILALIVLLVIQYKNPTPPRYYASIPSISPIDSNMEINIILGVKRQSPLWDRACLERATDVMVAYHGLPVAFATTGGEVCVSWWKLWRTQRTMVVARASKVGGLPIVDSLIADTLRRVGVFEVTFRIESTAGSGDLDFRKLVTCVVSPFNGAIACNVQYSQ